MESFLSYVANVFCFPSRVSFVQMGIVIKLYILHEIDLHNPKIVPELFCPAIHLHDAVYDVPSGTAVGTSISLRCRDNKLFPSGKDVMMIKCIQEYVQGVGVRAAWSQVPEDCLGREGFCHCNNA